jgi:hypothetical protein
VRENGFEMVYNSLCPDHRARFDRVTKRTEERMTRARS